MSKTWLLSGQRRVGGFTSFSACFSGVWVSTIFMPGYYGRGAAQLIITLLLGWVIIGIVVTVLWALIEICTVKEDANGDTMT